jgi:RNA polymerase sigma-70 factor (ECF subfamily)
MTPGTQQSDDALLHLAAGGDEEAFTALYRRRQAGIYRFALHMSGSVGLAEEVTQEVFITLVRNMRGFNPARGTVQQYLYGIARNYVLRGLERDGNYVALDEEAEDLLRSDTCLLGDLTKSETVDNVRRAVLSLPPAYREAVVLCDLQELSYAEAASILDLPIGTVRSKLSRGRALLIDKLSASSKRCVG